MARLPKQLRSPWLVGILLGVYDYLTLVVNARVRGLERFDGGVQSTTITYLLHGQVPMADFYEPYGIGLGIPGLLPRLMGFDGHFAERLTYAAFPAAVTTLATVFVWRRCGPALGIVVGLVTMASQISRYSIGWLALFGFLLLLDRAAGRTRNGSLQEIVDERPGSLIAAAAVLSLAGWARFEYAAFPAIWAIVLAVVLTGRVRWRLASITFGFAILPILVVVVAGGTRHLSWFVQYLLAGPPEGFHARRGQPILWHMAPDWVVDLVHGHLDNGPASYIGSYGVALVTVAAAAALLATRRGRERLLHRDPTYAVPFLVLLSTLVLYLQAARFSDVYGLIAVPIFWCAAVLLAGRLRPVALAAMALLLAWPLVHGSMPTAVARAWRDRPPVDARESVARFNRIPLIPEEAQSLAALPHAWDALGLNGRPVLSVSRRNDVAWANDAIVGYVLDAPPAAWPLTFDPGLVNRDAVQAEAVDDLCANRAPVVQLVGDYPDPHGAAAWVGSRRLDAFLATNYSPRAIAGFYRILLPNGRRCLRPEELGAGELAARRDRLFDQGELPEAGALALARLERAGDRPADADDAAFAALGGYRLAEKQLPSGPLGTTLRAAQSGTPVVPPRGFAAGRSDVQRLAAQTAWIAHHRPDDPSSPEAGVGVIALAQRHPRWGQAIANVAAIVPPSADLLADLARRGAVGVTQFDTWRLAVATKNADVPGALRAGTQLVADYLRDRDPVAAGNVELQLAALPGLDPVCALALRRRADARPGVWAPTASGSTTCPALQRISR